MTQHHVRSQVMQNRRNCQDRHPTPQVDPLIKQQSQDSSVVIDGNLGIDVQCSQLTYT
jgi:hypothetical protein